MLMVYLISWIAAVFVLILIDLISVEIWFVKSDEIFLRVNDI